MRNTLLLITISILTLSECNALQQIEFTDENSVLDFYCQYSSYTNPGKYEYLYENLPDSLPELCKLIKSQFIHPYAELPKYSEQIPKERWKEYIKYPTVKSILKGLHSYDSSGLVNNRKLEDRLILICRHNAILLASILKHRGIPTRVRAGYATYLAQGFHVNHAICEVWNKNDKRWMLVDPSMDMIDFNKKKFDFGSDAWLKMQQNEIDSNLYGVPGRYTGYLSILAILNTDLASILGNEYTTYQYAPMLANARKNNNQLSDKDELTLDKISELMKNPDAKNLLKLQELYNSTPEVQITESFINKTLSEESSDK